MKIPSMDTTVGPVTPTIPEAHYAKPVASAFMEGLGEVGTKIAGMLEQHAIDRQKLTDEAHLSDLDTNFRLNLQNKLLNTDTEKIKVNGQDVERPSGLLSRELSDAKGVSGEFEGYYADMRNRYLAQARTPEMQQALGKALDSQYLNARETVIKHEAKQGRLDLARAFNSSLEQQKQDVVGITDPNMLTLAVRNIQKTQDAINNLNEFDVTTSDVNRKNVAGDLVGKNATAILQTTGDLTKAQAMLDSQKEYMADDRYLELTKKLSDGYSAIQRRAQVVENTAKIQDRYNFIGDVANGKIDWNNSDDVIKNVAIKDPELAQAMKSIVNSGGQYVPTNDIIDNMAFMDVAKGVVKSATPEEASRFFVNTLKGKNGGNISKDKLGILVSVAKEHADAMRADATPESKNNWSVLKSAMSVLGSVAQFTPQGMIYNFLKAKYGNNLQGEAVKKAAKQAIKQGVLEAYPELGKLPILPNKIVGEDGNIQTIHEGNLGEYGDYTRDEE